MSDGHESLDPDGEGHVMRATLGQAEIEQTVAEYRELIGDLVQVARDHRTRCTASGCPGQTVIHALAEIVKKGPDMALTTLGLCVTFLASGETFVGPEGDHPLKDQELKEMLSGVLEEARVLGEPDAEGGPVS